MTEPGPSTSTLLSEQVAAFDWPGEIDQQTLLAGFVAITGLPADSASATAVEDCFLAAVGEMSDALELRPGGWTVKLTAGVVRMCITAAIMTGVLWQAGFDQMPTYVLPAALVVLVDVDRVRLSGRDKALLFQLRSHAGEASGAVVQPEVLYNRLPDSVRKDVSPLDFADFVQTLIAAGEADNRGGGDVRLRPNGQQRWIRITWQ